MSNSACSVSKAIKEVFPCYSCKKPLCPSATRGDFTSNKRALIFLCKDCKCGFWKIPTFIQDLIALKQVVRNLDNDIADIKTQIKILTSKNEALPSIAEPSTATCTII